MILQLQPISYNEACAFVNLHHRHHKAPQGHKFSIAANDGEKIVGVIMVGRPVSRRLDDTWTLEVTRCCTDGTPNASSFLYGAAKRAGFAMGYKRMITYTLQTEPGASLKGSGWKCIGAAGGGSWNTPSQGRFRVDKHPIEQKQLWEAIA